MSQIILQTIGIHLSEERGEDMVFFNRRGWLDINQDLTVSWVVSRSPVGVPDWRTTARVGPARWRRHVGCFVCGAALGPRHCNRRVVPVYRQPIHLPP